MIPYGRQSITQDDIDAVIRVLKSDLHERMQELEDAYERY
jgi:hypothetical protein